MLNLLLARPHCLRLVTLRSLVSVHQDAFSISAPKSVFTWARADLERAKLSGLEQSSGEDRALMRLTHTVKVAQEVVNVRPLIKMKLFNRYLLELTLSGKIVVKYRFSLLYDVDNPPKLQINM